MNPFYHALNGQESHGNPVPQNAPQMDFQSALRQVNEHPAEMLKQGGFNVPQECIGNNQATVMHLIRSGQVGGPMMRMISPLLARLGVR